ncbi:MAG: IS1595 family transposase [Deltaproteobacteria bacterium]|nr:IS1595 family transposase [Deltaproteobacteria bacterium]
METTLETLADFERCFSSQETCLDYLLEHRWPDGPVCPYCQSHKLWRFGPVLECSGCGRQIRIMAGTLFQDSKLDLRIWFRAVWYLVNNHNGISASELSRELGIRYPTVWSLLHKLRWAMFADLRVPLTGRVEVGEVFLTSPDSLQSGLSSLRSERLAIAVEYDGQSLGRLRMRVIDSAKGYFRRFIEENVELTSTLIIPDRLKDQSLEADYNCLTTSDLAKASSFPPISQISRVETLFKGWLMETFQGAVSEAYLDNYIDEFVFRFDRHYQENRGWVFRQVIDRAIQTPPIRQDRIMRIRSYI